MRGWRDDEEYESGEEYSQEEYIEDLEAAMGGLLGID